MNLDPGAERVHYDPEFDVRDLVSLLMSWMNMTSAPMAHKS